MIRCGKRILASLLVVLALCTQAATVALAAAPAPEAEPGPGYTLREDTTITEEAPPLAGMPEQACCVLHPLLMLAALLVAIYYTHASKRHQAREHELRASLLGP